MRCGKPPVTRRAAYSGPAFMTIETTAATSRLVTEKAGQAVEALFPKPAPVTEASLESVLPPGSHLGNQMKDAIRQNTLPYQEGSGTLTDAARQIDFALLQTVLRLKLDKGRIPPPDVRLPHARQGYLPPPADAHLSASGCPGSGPASASERKRECAVRRNGRCERPPRTGIPLPQRAGRKPRHMGRPRRAHRIAGQAHALATKGVLTHEIWFEATTDAFPILPPTDKAPRLTIVMNELGGDKAVTASLLALKLPITFSVLPFAKDAAATATAARTRPGRRSLWTCRWRRCNRPSSRRGPGENHHEDVRGRHAGS